MSIGSPQIRFLFDEGVPDPAQRPLLAAGHEVILHRSILAPGSSDDLVCLTAIVNEAVLVAIDGDMKRFAKRYGNASMNQRFDKLDLVMINCGEVLASKRLEQSISFIEHEWDFKQKKKARRLWMEIGEHHLKTYR